MKRRILLLLTTLLPLVASAYDAEIDGIFYNFNGDEAEVTCDDVDYSSYEDDVVVPESVTYKGKTYQVTAIGDFAFCDCWSMTSCTLPKGIKRIGMLAFEWCSYLTTITIPESVTTIGDAAFNGSGLTSIFIPKNVTSIGIEAFADCTDLGSIAVDAANKVFDSRGDCDAIIETATNRLIAGCNGTVIPEDVTCIGEYAFAGSGIETLFIPKNVTAIAKNAFHCFYNYVESIAVDTENKVFDSRNDCNAIIETATKKLIFGCKNTVIPNGVTSIESAAFHGCTMTSFDIPESVTSIGDIAFEFCWKLTEINLSKGLKEIGASAFENCDGLKTITLPEGLTSIGENAFARCANLTGIVIPKSVTKLGTTPFLQCPKLDVIKVEEGNTVYDSRNDCNAIIETATNRLIEGCNGTVIPEDVTSIAARSFFDCRTLPSITIPKDVTVIEDGTFYYLDALTSITIPEGVTDINYRGIYCCMNLEQVSIPSTVTKIGEGAFAYCEVLKDVYCFAGQVPETGKGVFNNTPIEDATLHVPAAAIEAYRKVAPWNNFGTIVALTATPVESISNEAENAPTTYYDLQGRKVMNPTRGIYLMNGKKVLVK